MHPFVQKVFVLVSFLRAAAIDKAPSFNCPVLKRVNEPLTAFHRSEHHISYYSLIVVRKLVLLKVLFVILYFCAQFLYVLIELWFFFRIRLILSGLFSHFFIFVSLYIE
jgi:hypothetical protein